MLANLGNLIPSEGKQFDIPQMFEQSTGLRPEVYFPLVMATMAKYATLDVELFQSPHHFAVRLDWFSNTSLDNAKLERFLADLSADYTEFKRLLGLYDKGISDFTIFRERPVVRLADDFYPIDFAFLAAKSESAFFWRTQSSLPSKQRENFHAFWGMIFEKYVHRLLKQSVDGSINQYYESPKYAGRENEQVCDGIMLCKGYAAVFMEYKGSMFRADAKWSGNVTLLEQELQTKLIGKEGGSPKGVKQLANAISNVFGSGQTVSGMDLGSISKVYPVLVTYDEIGDAWFLANYLNEAFKKAVNRKSMSVTVTPVFCVSADPLEALAGILNKVALCEILEGRYKQDWSLKMPLWKRWRSAGPVQFANHDAEIPAVEMRVLVREDVGLDVAEGRFGLVLDSLIEGLDNVLLEVRRAGERLHHRLSLGVGKFVVSEAEDIHLDARRQQRDDRMHVLWNAGCRVQRDRRPHGVDICLRDSALLQEIPRRIRAVHLEALIVAAMRLGQTHVVKHGPRVEQFRIEFQAAMLAGQRRE